LFAYAGNGQNPNRKEVQLMAEKQITQVTATYDRDSKRFHRFIVDEDQGIVGNIYCPKGETVPKEVTIVLKSKEK